MMYRKLLALLISFAAPAVLSGQGVEDRVLEGTLQVLWGDSIELATVDSTQPPPRAEIRWTVTTTDGTHHELTFSEELARRFGDFVSWNGSRVRASLVESTDRATGPRRAVALTLLGGRSVRGGVTGPQPWVTLPCKFSDIGTEPEDEAFFDGMYDNAPGRLDHYWRELSYEAINVVGSMAIDWITLPGTQGSYVPTPGSGTGANLDRLFDDCTAAADAQVDFSGGGTPFVGINLMFNAALDCCAWGGGRWATLDGVSKVWRTTWNPPWAFANEGVIAHEMGHGFGLPHANNWDGDSSPYDSPWDVMSAATSNAVSDATYGALGKHINGYHKNQLQWIPASERLEVPPGSSATVVVEPLSLETTNELRLVTVPVAGSNRWYTVEVRDRLGNYDGNLPGFAVILHEVDPSRSEPSWAVDGAVPPADFGNNAGTMWVAGEAFTDAAAGITIEVLFESGAGFQIRVNNGDTGVIFLDGFETGDASLWSTTVP